MIIVMIGVSGSGKTTIGTMLAEAMHCPFLDGDALHPQQNIDKMTQGIPLADADRAPWLAAVHARILHAFEHGQDLVVACSALKQQYRTFLAEGASITWVYLKGSAELIHARLSGRLNHFMTADMLASQLDALEEPAASPEIGLPEGDHGHTRPSQPLFPLSGFCRCEASLRRKSGDDDSNAEA